MRTSGITYYYYKVDGCGAYNIVYNFFFFREPVESIVPTCAVVVNASDVIITVLPLLLLRGPPLGRDVKPSTESLAAAVGYNDPVDGVVVHAFDRRKNEKKKTNNNNVPLRYYICYAECV